MIEIMSSIHIVVELLLANPSHSQGGYRLSENYNYFMIEVMSTIHIVVHVVLELLLANPSHSQGGYRFCLKTIITL